MIQINIKWSIGKPKKYWAFENIKKFNSKCPICQRYLDNTLFHCKITFINAIKGIFLRFDRKECYDAYLSTILI